MTPHWGINWQRYHSEGEVDMRHIERMGYRSFTIYEWMWNNRDFVRELVAAARDDALFLDRDHPLSEQKGDMYRDPVGTGVRHADEWARKVQEGRVYTPLDRTFFLGINEPESNTEQVAIDRYNEAYCRRMAAHGLRAAAYSFGVGHPSSVDLRPDTLPDWSWYDASAAAVLEGSHIVAFHEYGAPDGYGWGYWCNRSRYCPHPFDVVLDECGIDNGVVNSGQLYGWAKFMTPEEYVHWLDGFQFGMAERANTRTVNILTYNIFGYDHGDGESKDWHSFDIRPCRALLESYQWSVAETADAPAQHDVHVPIVTTPPAPTSAPTQPQPSDNWQRSRDFVRQWEGGWADHPADRGGPTNKGITLATFKRWREMQGMPEPTKDDLRNISDDETDAIFYHLYWLPSKANTMPWPSCLVQYDTAVLHGVDAAHWFRREGGGSDLAILGLRLLTYSGSIDDDASQEVFWNGWRNRVMDVREIVRSDR